jgi:acetylornithine aminotransferase
MGQNQGHTKAYALASDERILKAKELIREALKDHTQHIKGLAAPKEELKETYAELLKELSQNRGGNLFYKYIGSGLGNGPFVELCDGSVKYDFITGIGVHYFGHSHPDLLLAAVDGAIENTTMQGHLQQNFSSHQLIKILVEQASKYGAPLKHAFLTSSGAMANENALKLAFHKRTPASRVLAFERCFSGRTLGLSFVTDKALYRAGLPKTLDVDYLPFFDELDPEGSTKKTIITLKKYLKRFPKQHAAILVEPIQGEGGTWAGNADYFREVLSLVKQEGISIIMDEVQTFGRTEELFAFQYYKLDDLVDIVTIGKMSQVCATLFREDHKPAAGLISQTYTSSSSAIHASLCVLNKMVNDGFLGKEGKISKIGHYFRSKLKELEQTYPHKITGPWGVGVMVAMTVYGGDAKKSSDFAFKLFDNGVLSFTAGEAPTRVRFLVPTGAVETKHIDEVIKIIETTLKEIE